MNNSGIIDVDGSRIVPESIRPDGTIRRARKVRDGFIPVEDVEKYRPPRRTMLNQARKMHTTKQDDGKAEKGVIKKESGTGIEEALDRLSMGNAHHATSKIRDTLQKDDGKQMRINVTEMKTSVSNVHDKEAAVIKDEHGKTQQQSDQTGSKDIITTERKPKNNNQKDPFASLTDFPSRYKVSQELKVKGKS